jgi:hypothetical protein
MYGDRIYVVDASIPVVRVYDSEGRHVRSFGRSGRGPGEMLRASSIDIDSLVHVFDPAQQRTVSFTLDGEHRRTASLDGGRPMSAVQPYALRTGHVLIHRLPAFALGRPDHQPNELLLIVSESGSIDTIASFHSGAAIYHPEGSTLPWGVVPTDLGRGGAWAVLGDSAFVVADGRTGVVTSYVIDAGGYRTVRELQLNVSGQSSSRSDIDHVRREFERTRRRSARGLALILPPYRSAITGAVSAGSAGLWLRSRYDGQRTMAVFLRTGLEPAWVTRLEGRVRMLAADADRLLTAVEREDGTILLRMYRMR